VFVPFYIFLGDNLLHREVFGRNCTQVEIKIVLKGKGLNNEERWPGKYPTDKKD